MSERLLESRISALRGQVRRLLVFHGLSWLIAVVVPLVLLAGLADWLFHLDVFVRLALLLALGAVALWVVFKLVLRPLLVRFADLDIAMRIEERWPGLHDRLASTIQFLRLDPADDRYGSPALREATIRQAIEETRSLDFREAIDYRPIVRAGSLAAAAVSLALLFGLLDPASTRIAMRRLFVPWGGDRWPQQTHLALTTRARRSRSPGAIRSRSRSRSVRETGSRKRPGLPTASPTARRSPSRSALPREASSAAGSRRSTSRSSSRWLAATTWPRSATSRSRSFPLRLSTGSPSGWCRPSTRAFPSRRWPRA